MNNEEIKKIAAEIANTLYNEDRTYNHHLWWSVEPKERKAEEVEDIINVILRDYCIVPRSKIAEEVEDTKWLRKHGSLLEVEIRKNFLSDLFGSSLFQ